MSALSPSAQKGQPWLLASGCEANIVDQQNPERTAAKATVLLICDVAQIAKSIIFKSGISGRSIFVITNDVNRVTRRNSRPCLTTHAPSLTPILCANRHVSQLAVFLP